MRILASKELRRVAGNRASNGGADVDDEEGEVAAGVAAAKGRIVTQLMKKNLVQNAIPIFIELKRYGIFSSMLIFQFVHVPCLMRDADYIFCAKLGTLPL